MKFKVSTKGHNDIINITDQVARVIQESGIEEGMAFIFVAHSTAAITTIEYEDGVIKDIDSVLEKYIPENYDYEHHKRWGDHNGAAHIKAAIFGPDLSVPIEDAQAVLGSWQQIVLIDFDKKEREREVMVRVIKSD